MTELCYPPDTDWGCYGDQAAIDALDPAIKERSEALAWMQLAALTADQVGVCPIVVRPCSQACLGGSHVYLVAPVGATGRYAGVGPGGFTPHIGAGGRWVNSCGCALGDCSCTVLCEAILPGPVGGVVAVTLDGATLAPDAYRVDGGNRLVRTDGGCWPACQDMAADITTESYAPLEGGWGTSGRYGFTRTGDQVTLTVMADAVDNLPGSPLPDRFAPASYQAVGQNLSVRATVQSLAGVGTFQVNRLIGSPAELVMVYTATAATPDVTGTPGTFAVTYYQGAAPDPLSLYIAGLLAAEYYKACTADKTCRLPQKLQSVARQGVTYQVAFEDDGTTGIREVDDYVARLNPYRLKMPSAIVSPDSRRARQTTWSR